MGIGTKSMKKWGNGDSREAEAVSKHVAQLKIKFPSVFWRLLSPFRTGPELDDLHCTVLLVPEEEKKMGGILL